MIALLAQLPDPGSTQAIGWLFLALFGAVGGINQILRITDRFKEHPPIHSTYATKEEHKDLAIRLDEELGRERGARKKIHEEIGSLQSGMSSLTTETENLTEAVAGMKTQIENTNDRIDKVPERVINLLRSTKGLIE